MRISTKNLTIGGALTATGALVCGLLWAADNIKQVETNKQDIATVTTTAEDTDKILQVQDKRLTIVEIEHKAMMESIKQSSAADRVIMEDIKGLMMKMINGGHKHE